MEDPRTLIVRLGGAAKTCELRAGGISKKRLAASVRTGYLLRPRSAWYVLPSTPSALRAAVRVGGRATCLTALDFYGVWLTDRVSHVHVAVHRAASRLRAASNRHERQSVVGDAVVHWVDVPRPREATPSRLVEPPLGALRDAIGCLRGDDLLATVESVLNRGLVDVDEWRALLSDLPRADRVSLARASGLSGSGIESLFVARIHRLGVAVAQQVQIGPDRVDAVLGDRLVVELDGEGFHDRHADYVRDTRLVTAGFRVLRFDYGQVMLAWPTVERAVIASLERGDHLG